MLPFAGSAMTNCSFVTGHCCTFTKSYSVLAWQLTTAKIKHVLSLGWERESARDPPDRTNRWRGGFPTSSPAFHCILALPIPPRLSAVKCVCLIDISISWLCLTVFCCAFTVLLMVFRSTSTSTSRLAEKPGQDTQLITVDEKLVRIPSCSTWPTDGCLSDLPITFLENHIPNPC